MLAKRTFWGVFAIVMTGIVFVTPFIFIMLTASKPLAESNLLQFSWPSHFQLLSLIHI